MVSQLILICLVNIVIGESAHCDGASSSEACILDCSGTGSCTGQTLNCMNSHTCLITCDADHACSHATINASQTIDVTVICSAPSSCPHSLNIKCGTGQCRLLCDGINTCSDLSLSVSPSSDFECVGNCPEPISSAHSSSQWVIATTTTNQQTLILTSAGSMVDLCVVVVLCTCMASIIGLYLYYGCSLCSLRMERNKQIAVNAFSKPNMSPSHSLFSIPEEPPSLSLAIPIEWIIGEDIIEMDGLSETNEWADYCAKSGEIDEDQIINMNRTRRFFATCY